MSESMLLLSSDLYRQRAPYGITDNIQMVKQGCQISRCLQLQILFAEQHKVCQSHPKVVENGTELSMQAALVMTETDLPVVSAAELRTDVHTALAATTHLMLCCAVLTCLLHQKILNDAWHDCY